MRRFLPLLLAILMPLQWSVAAVGALPGSPEASVVTQAADDAQGAARAHRHAHEHPALNADSEVAARAVPIASKDPSVVAGDDAVTGTTDPDCPAGAHLHACCHAPTVALPVAVGLILPSPSRIRLIPPVVLPPHPRASEGPFRPPRTVTA
ncbi:MAG: hypothetical protein RIS35_683 [Pseudomonadota bacterium]